MSKSYQKDLTGQNFGDFTVVRFIQKNNKPTSWWEIKCNKCGLVKELDIGHLKQKNRTKCNCPIQLYTLHNNFLTKEELRNDGGQKCFLCECVVCNTTKIIREESLKKLKGFCCKNCKIQEMINQRFGKLIVLEKSPIIADEYYYICKCDCGSIKTIRGSSLRLGITNSCGCYTYSKGEDKIKDILNENNIKFIRQFTFKNLKSKKNRRLLFDFGIINDDKDLLYLIEYHGIQHYMNPHNENKFFDYTSQDVQDMLERDQLKEDYCIKNNIPLIIIPYWEYLNINIDMITLKSK